MTEEEKKIKEFVDKLVESSSKYESPYSRNPLDDILAEDDEDDL